ncbi:MAG TPA: patatin-like phospholipase family protein, partial [Actinomycetota bacterium]|nr:patatin-like phospholipase family protein [Actinomycetota bacterium]
MAGANKTNKRTTAFVLGGGGHHGAFEVGMLRALLERDLRPDFVVGTSVGALNGAAIAADPTLEMVDRLRTIWLSLDDDSIFGGSLLSGAANFVRSRTHMHSNRALRAMITQLLPVQTFEELAIPFQCVAASIERAAEHWFFEGALADAILASAAVPGVLPPVKIDGEHFVDGGIVNSIPISRAVELGATDIYVLH